MRSHREEFPRNVKEQAWERCKGRCECGCMLKIQGTPIYDHFPVAAALGGPGTLANCRVLDPKCNKLITSTKDIPAIAKTHRIRDKRIGLRKTSRPFRTPPEGYDPWRRRMRDE